MTEVLISNHVQGGYGKKQIIHGVNLDIHGGEWLSIIGANGSGKSTFLKLISRLLTPNGGVVLLNGKNIHTQPVRAVARELALLPQQTIIPKGITVNELVSLGRNPHQEWWQWQLDTTSQRKVQEAIEQTQLVPLQDRSVESLSGGERQRAFLAMALAQSPRVLLLDEPTTFLDLRYQLELLELLKQLQISQNLTIVTVLHDMNLSARFSDRLAVMKAGELLAIGTPTEILQPDIIRSAFGLEVEIIAWQGSILVHPVAGVPETRCIQNQEKLPCSGGGAEF
jgi:iron complex transport system ATP-binding protein